MGNVSGHIVVVLRPGEFYALLSGFGVDLKARADHCCSIYIMCSYGKYRIFHDGFC